MANMTFDEIMEELEKPVKWEFDGNESEFETNLLEHIEEIRLALRLPLIEAVGRQKQIRLSDDSQIIMDIVVRHTDGTATIFEVKKYNNKYPHTGTANQVQAIGQLLLYASVFEAETGIRPRLVMADNKIFKRTLYVFSETKLPITLLELQKDRLFIPYVGW